MAEWCGEDFLLRTSMWLRGRAAAQKHYDAFGFYVIPDTKSDFGRGFNEAMMFGYT